MNFNLGDQFEARIDFVGQQLVSQISNLVLILATAVSFIVGFALQSLTATFSIFGGSVIVLALLILPPWPFLNRNPVKWNKTSSTSDSKKTR